MKVYHAMLNTLTMTSQLVLKMLSSYNLVYHDLLIDLTPFQKNKFMCVPE